MKNTMPISVTEVNLNLMPMAMVSGAWGDPIGPIIPFQVCLVPSETPGSPLYYGWREKRYARLVLSWRLGLIDPPTPGKASDIVVDRKIMPT